MRTASYIARIVRILRAEGLRSGSFQLLAPTTYVVDGTGHPAAFSSSDAACNNPRRDTRPIALTRAVRTVDRLRRPPSHIHQVGARPLSSYFLPCSLPDRVMASIVCVASFPADAFAKHRFSSRRRARQRCPSSRHAQQHRARLVPDRPSPPLSFNDGDDELHVPVTTAPHSRPCRGDRCVIVRLRVQFDIHSSRSMTTFKLFVGKSAADIHIEDQAPGTKKSWRARCSCPLGAYLPSRRHPPAV